MKVKYILFFSFLSLVFCLSFIRVNATLCYNISNDNRVLDRRNIQDDCDNNKRFAYNLTSSSSWLTNSSCFLFYLDKKIYNNFIMSPTMKESEWDLPGNPSIGIKMTKITDMNNIIQEVNPLSNRDEIFRANLYTKTNVTFHLLNSTNNEMYNTSEIYYITPEGNEVKAPNSVPNNLPIGEYSWHFTAILVDLKCDFNMDGSPDGISVIPSTRLDEKVVIEENVVIEEKEGIQKFYDDREKEIGIISHQATRVNINCKV